MKKRLLASLMVLCIVVGMLPTAALAVDSGTLSGNCGAEGGNVTWKLTPNNEGETYTLTISGSGAMADYTVDTGNQSSNGYYKVTDSPWVNHVDKITKVELSTGISKIGVGAFNSCAITELPWSGRESQYSGLTEIGNFAFAGCTSLSAVTFVPSVTTYGNYVFEGCTSLTAIDWTNYQPAAENSDKLSVNGVLVATGLFAECSSLSSALELPERIEGIDRAAFRNTGYTAIDFTTGAPRVKVIEEQAFSKSKLKSIILPSAEAHPNTKFGVSAFEETKVETISIPYYADAGDNNISEKMFQNCTDLHTVVLGDEISSIGKEAFKNTKVSTINWPASLATIGGAAFSGTSIEDLDMPATVTTIGKSAFYGTSSLKSVTIRAEAVSIGYGAFAQCSSLETIDLTKVTSLTTPDDGGSLFLGIKDGSALYVKDASLILENRDKWYSPNLTALIVVGDADVDAAKTGFSAVTREEYTAKWYDNSGYGGSPVETIAKTDSNNKSYPTYYAKWVSVITFDGNGGEGSMTAQEITEGDTAQLTANGFAKTGYTFDSWKTVADGTGDSYADQATAPSGNTTLYAQWKPNTYTISFDGNNATGGSTTQVDATYDTPAKLTANGFIKDDSNFAGWASTQEKANAGGVDYSNGAQVLNLTATDDKVTLYAVWTKKTVLTPNVSKQTKTYNGAEQAFELAGGYTITYQQNGVNTTPQNAGEYDVVISAAETDSTAAYNNTVYGGLVIEPAPLTITAKDKTIYVGDDLPDYTCTVTGWQGQDKALFTSPTFSCTAADSNDAGSYPITVEGADAGGNYTINYVNGTLTILQRSGSDTETEVTTNPDGSTVVTRTQSDGTVITTRTETNGVVAQVVNKPGEEPVVTVTIPEGLEEATVLVPGSVGNGMVPVNPETGEILRASLPTEEGMLVKLEGTAQFILRDNAGEFADTQNHWAEDAIDFTTARELFLGTGSATFSPNSSMTRAMLMTVLARFDGQNTAGETWYEKGMEWARENGVSDGSDPHDGITREELVTMLYRYAGSPATDGSLSAFPDGDKVSGYAEEAMAWAVSTGLIGGMENGALNPKGDATRAQVATVLMRYMEIFLK